MNIVIRDTIRRIACFLFIMSLLTQQSCINGDGSARETPHDKVSERKLKMIGEAFLRYKNEHNFFPDSENAVGRGQKHSWRFLLLKYFAFNDEHRFDEIKKYDVAEPWDSEKNRQWGFNNESFALRYACSDETISDSDRGFFQTSYLMLNHDVPINSLPAEAVIVVESLNCGTNFL